ncbi:hypothetical protein DLH72_03435 [Candidatus Gracilibacteria bacterium]|nr:MAG: hypothetical protein DLH72_03435 [Candidatus Gracilibacteria bacterium]
MNGIESKNNSPETNNPQNSIEVLFKGLKIELKGDNKLTKNELKFIESLAAGDKEKILEDTKTDLNKLKEIILNELKSRYERGGNNNKYINSLIVRTEGRLNKKIEEKKNLESTVAEEQENIVIDENVEQDIFEYFTEGIDMGMDKFEKIAQLTNMEFYNLLEKYRENIKKIPDEQKQAEVLEDVKNAILAGVNEIIGNLNNIDEIKTAEIGEIDIKSLDQVIFANINENYKSYFE